MVPKPALPDVLKLLPILERLSLLKADHKTVVKMQETIASAQLMRQVDTTGVEPLITLLEDKSLRLRSDIVEATSKEAILATSSKTIEDYFVAPPGNIPLGDDDQFETKQMVKKLGKARAKLDSE